MIMDWVYQVIGVLLALAPMIVGTILWHFIWKNNDSGSSQDPPPPGDPWRRPVPPPPKLHGDRGPRSSERPRVTTPRRPVRLLR